MDTARKRPRFDLVVNGDDMSVLIYVLLTLAIFALLGTALKLVERL